MTDLLTELSPMVEGIASEFGRSNRVYGAETADFSQELYLWIVKNENKVRTWLDPEDPAHGLLVVSLKNVAKAYAVGVKAQALGYERDDLHWYNKGELKALLPLMFNDDAWHEPPQSEGRSAKAPSEGGNWIATLADVAQAYSKLDAKDQRLLRWFHKDDRSNQDLADDEGVTHQSMSERHDRAIGRLLRILGGTVPTPMREARSEPRDPWKGRRSVTNSTARSYQGAIYDD
jgi:hypothetical protein